MSVIDGGWALIAQATADRKVDAIIAECVDQIDRQLPMLHALYDMLQEKQYQEVALVLRMVQGEWL